MKPPRVPLYGFPDVVLHSPESRAKGHPEYAAAKGGDLRAADVLSSELVSSVAVEQVARMVEGRPVELVAIHALESAGVNEIPAALATVLSRLLGLPVNSSMVQLNSVGHTGADGFRRLANQALFSGTVVPGASYFVVDDFVGQGGTLANLIGLISSQGGHVLGATVLTGKPYSAKLAPDEAQIQALRAKHGPDLEKWWQQSLGFGFECLTRSEARYLDNTADAQTIRDRLAAAGLAGGP
jgi:adenine/guanine phosphoribosyltransferase-like PRPP-binding protein